MFRLLVGYANKDSMEKELPNDKQKIFLKPNLATVACLVLPPLTKQHNKIAKLDGFTLIITI